MYNSSFFYGSYIILKNTWVLIKVKVVLGGLDGLEAMMGDSLLNFFNNLFEDDFTIIPLRKIWIPWVPAKVSFLFGFLLWWLF